MRERDVTSSQWNRVDILCYVRKRNVVYKVVCACVKIATTECREYNPIHVLLLTPDRGAEGLKMGEATLLGEIR